MFEIFKGRFVLVLAFALIINLFSSISAPTVVAKEENPINDVSYSDYYDLEGNVVGVVKREITIKPAVVDVEGTSRRTVTEVVTYDFNEDFEFKDRIVNEVNVTEFAIDVEGNTYIDGELVDTSSFLAVPDEPMISVMDSGGHWKYTYYNCDYQTQCYLYTGSGASFNLQNVDNAYAEAWLFKNSTNNGKISDFKLYATQAANAVSAYNNASASYVAILIGTVLIPIGGAVALLAGGGTLASIEAVQAYNAWKSLNKAMANAYSLIT